MLYNNGHRACPTGHAPYLKRWWQLKKETMNKMIVEEFETVFKEK